MGTSTPESVTAKVVNQSAPAAESRLAETWRRFRQHKPALVGLSLIMLFVVVAATAPLLSHQDPVGQDLSRALLPPSTQHWLGTDQLGRDILTRLLYGGRLSLTMGALAVVLGMLVGVPLGATSGYYGGMVDMVIQRITDILLSFPSFLLALSLVAVLGVGLQNTIIAVGIGTIPIFIRLVRGVVLSLREQTYVEAARSLGQRDFTILSKHIVPNALAPVIVQATLSMGSTILVAAGLGFLGLGVQAPTPEWGSMLGEGKQFIFSAMNLATFPGVAIFLTVLAFNLAGDGLRDALDPRLRNR